MNSQSRIALEIANERRAAMRATREHVVHLDFVAGCARVAEILRSPTDHEAAMPIGRMLLAIDRLGVLSLGVALREAGIISADRRLRQLTVRQREVLALHLQARASRYRPTKAAA